MTQPPPGHRQHPTASPPPYPPRQFTPGWNPQGPGTRPPGRRKYTALILVTVAISVVAVLVGVVALVERGSSTQASPPDDLPAFPTASTLRQIPTSTTQRGPQQVAELGEHPLSTDRNAGLYDIACDYAPWGLSPEQARKFYESALSCMNKAWKRVLGEKILPFSEPNLEVPARAASLSTPCASRPGAEEPPAFYCPTNHTIYMPMDTVQTDIYGDDSVIYLGILAHEYGHHVQTVSGIGKQAQITRWLYDQGSEKELVMTRRLELQAQCFAGMFFTAAADTMTPEQYARVVEDTSIRGDGTTGARDHGTPRNNAFWVANGLVNRLSQCNTWIAPAESVD